MWNWFYYALADEFVQLLVYLLLESKWDSLQFYFDWLDTWVELKENRELCIGPRNL